MSLALDGMSNFTGLLSYNGYTGTYAETHPPVLWTGKTNVDGCLFVCTGKKKRRMTAQNALHVMLLS